MYDINMKNIVKSIGSYFLFVFIGGIFFVPAVLSLIPQKKENQSLYDTLAVIKHVEVETVGNTSDIPVYYYDVNGEEHRCPVFEARGQKPNLSDVVYYRSSNPNDCKIIVEEQKNTNIIGLVIIILFPGVFVWFGLSNIIKLVKIIFEIRYLNKHGKLVKNLPYRLENSNVSINDVKLKHLVICYFLPDGNTVVLRSDPKFDRKLRDADGCVDLVIDENDPTRYFIDLEINRKGGNLPQDFCNQEKYKQFFQNNNNVINPYNDNCNVVNQYNNPYDD